jgi:hypothetical protein
MFSDLRPTPNLKNQVPALMSPSDRVAQLYSQTPSSLSVAFHDSQAYDRYILTLLHKEDQDIQLNVKYSIYVIFEKITDSTQDGKLLK